MTDSYRRCEALAIAFPPESEQSLVLTSPPAFVPNLNRFSVAHWPDNCCPVADRLLARRKAPGPASLRLGRSLGVCPWLLSLRIYWNYTLSVHSKN
jgi:hypothetical protein